MELYWDYKLLSADVRKEDLESALARVPKEREAKLTLSRHEDEQLQGGIITLGGQVNYVLQFWRGSVTDVILLSPDEWEKVADSMRGYLKGKIPLEFQGSTSEPDCPICAMLARQTGPAADSWTRWN